MIAIGADDAGRPLKEALKKHFDERGIECYDFGADGQMSRDYPDIAVPLAKAIAAGEYERGILVCGTGIGMSIAANKIHGVRAAVCSDCFSARFTRLHNDANILCLGARVLGSGLACEIADLFVDTPFEGGRHKRRVEKIMSLETDSE